jgi:hypothetical protein
MCECLFVNLSVGGGCGWCGDVIGPGGLGGGGWDGSSVVMLHGGGILLGVWCGLCGDVIRGWCGHVIMRRRCDWWCEDVVGGGGVCGGVLGRG